MEVKKEFVQDVWPDVYASRQSKKILKWPVTASTSTGSRPKKARKKVLYLVVGKERVLGLIPLDESGVKIDERNAINRFRLVKFVGQEVAFVVTGIDFENERTVDMTPPLGMIGSITKV